MRKYWYRKCLIITLVFSVFFYTGYSVKEKMERNEKEEVSAGTVSDNTVIPGGMPIGIYLETEGVMVLGTEKVTGTDGERLEPARHLVKAGDYIVECNGTKIRDKKELQTILKTTDGTDVILKLRRDSEYLEVKVKPVRSKKNNCMLGIWVRDNAQGLGTVTFLNSDSRFGALGHGINDTDTGELLQLGSGLLYHTEIVAIRKGERGTPGELTGINEYQPEQVSGVIMSITAEGIYGVASQAFADSITTQALPVGLKQDVKEGDAQILCNIDGQTKYYDVRITRLMPNAENLNRQIALTVTDEELLQLTGGIVQGMSGAPIIQDGRIIGAVTHVLVNDSTSGYGIFIENML